MLKIHKAKNGQFYYTICAKNGKVLHQTETLEAPASVLKNINATIAAILDNAIVDTTGKFPQFKQVKPKPKAKK